MTDNKRKKESRAACEQRETVREAARARLLQPVKIRLAIRGFGDGVKQFEERVDIDACVMPEVVPALAEKHAAALSRFGVHMVEIEFLDEANPLARFFRVGTDPSGMVLPLAIDGGLPS